MGRLDGKVALVTGAASGIGLACVARFAAEGARVVGLDLTEPQGELTLPSGAADVSFAQADVRDEDAIAARDRAVVAEHGRIDSIVTAAGVAGGGPAHMVDRDEWQRVLDVNLTGTFLSAKHAIAHMLEQDPIDGERGSVVTVASVEGLEGTAGGSSYNASKGAVVIFTKNLAIDYGRAGIRANCDLSGLHRDAAARRRVRHAGNGARARVDPRGAQAAPARAARGDRVGRAVPRLRATLRSSRGQALAVDGGYTAGRDHGVTEMFGL